MGSFAYTCAISRLPIECGDAVRCLLLTRNPYGAANTSHTSIEDTWFVRTFPIKASYNDYGSIDNYNDEFGQQLWLDGFQLDLIEKGWGENTIHDVPVRKEQDFETLLNALRSSRVEVTQQDASSFLDMFKKLETLRRVLPADRHNLSVRMPKAAVYVPNLVCVEKELEQAGLKIGEYCKTDGYLVREIEYGMVSIRHTAFKYDVQLAALKKARNALNKYGYSMLLRAGTDSSLQLLLCIPPNQDQIYTGNTFKYAPGTVALAMIREDVWQSLLTIQYHTWRGVRTIDAYYKSVVHDYAYSTLSLHDAPDSCLDLHLHQDKLSQDLGSTLAKEGIHGTLGLATHWRLACMSDLPEIKVEEFLRSVAETVFIQSLLWNVRYAWTPAGSCGPQFGEYKLHTDFLAKIHAAAEICQKKHEKEMEDHDEDKEKC